MTHSEAIQSFPAGWSFMYPGSGSFKTAFGTRFRFPFITFAMIAASNAVTRAWLI
ncbi:MAG TPA: hypothetical protein VHT28_04905 [Silvibacterium sp.]|jgi:hypothetical protein|nr:hypothetical protein [Silvibacterium sp.]